MGVSPARPDTWQNTWTETWIALGSLQFFIPLITVLSLAVALGTFLDPPAMARWLQGHPDWSGPVRNLGLTDIYHAFWFQALLAMLALNLLACVTRRLPPLPLLWRLCGRAPAKAPVPPASAVHHDLPPLSPRAAASLLRARWYHPREFAQADGSRLLYAERGVWGLVGPWITHVGILVVLLGGLYGSIAGFKSYVEGTDGTVITYGDVQRQMRTVPWIKPRVPRDWEMRVERFWIDYDQRRMPRQYYSTLTVQRGGSTVDRQTIWVNRPLEYAGLTFYQANWGPAALRLKIDGQDNRLPLSPMQEGGWIAGWPATGQPRYLFIMEQADGPVFLFGHGGERFTRLAPGNSVTLYGRIFAYQGAVLKTGLEVGYDPGYPLVATGFLILTLGVCLVWLAHKQVWLHLPAPGRQEQSWLAGWAPKGRLSLEEDLNAMLARLATVGLPVPVAEPVIYPPSRPEAVWEPIPQPDGDSVAGLWYDRPEHR